MKLAVNGGEPVRKTPFPPYLVIGEEEKHAVSQVLDSHILSKYLGCFHEDFYGGPQVRTLEREWADYFSVKHAIAVNSCTSGLFAAVGAMGVEPGDEIIVTPYTMSASATAALIFNVVPVFADIEPDFFCLDPATIENKITARTRGIIVVDLFGLPYDADAINAVAKKHGLFVIEDTAQAPGAIYNGKLAGTLADIGVFSLNYHKHIHCGEGGIVVTNDDRLAERLRLIRNHAESVVEDMGVSNLSNMIGFNFRLPEIEAAIIRCQLKKLPELIHIRQENCNYLSEKLKEIPAIQIPEIRNGCTHVYYVHPLKFDEDLAGVSRDAFVHAVRAELPVTTLRENEGPLISCGYVKPLYLLPMYQQRIGYGTKGFPFNASSARYDKGICPVAERMFEKELFLHELMRPGMTRKDLNDVIAAFVKVWEHRAELIDRGTTHAGVSRYSNPSTGH